MNSRETRVSSYRMYISCHVSNGREREIPLMTAHDELETIHFYGGVKKRTWNHHAVAPGAYAYTALAYGWTLRTNTVNRVCVPVETQVNQDSSLAVLQLLSQNMAPAEPAHGTQRVLSAHKAHEDMEGTHGQ